MKIKFFDYLAVVPIILGLTACGKHSTPSTTTTHLAGITLISYTSEDFSISGLVPEGWVETKPGQFQRMPGNDPTLLGQVAFQGATREQVTTDLQLPDNVGSMETPNLTWDLYGGELELPEAGTLVLDIALTEFESGVYFVVLVTLADEHETLHEAVMVPVIHALAPAMVPQGRPVAMSATPLAQELVSVDTQVRTTDGMIMVYVPAGEFDMGNRGTQWIWNGSLRDSDLGLQIYTDESPQHVVFLDAFWIDQTEVAVDMFRTFVEATGYETTAEREGWGAPWKNGPKEGKWPHVPGVDWQHCRKP